MALRSANPRARRGFSLALLLAHGSVLAAPYLPTSDDAQLAQLPRHAPSGVMAPRAADAELAAVLVQAYLQRARLDGDPRFLGYAEGELRPWRTDPAPPGRLLLLRATLLQARHNFSAALDDLDRYLQDEPTDAQALLTRATLHRVLGRYPEALTDCDRLGAAQAAFVAQVCALGIGALTGALHTSLADLAEMQAGSHRMPAAVRGWYLAERAAMAERAGQDALAERLYRQALTATPDDPRIRSAAADLMLRVGQPGRALDLLGEAPGADILRLRQSLALHAMGQPRPRLDRLLAEGYATARRRGEAIHLREESRFALHILNDADRALQLAEQNWASQKEPEDLLLLQQAALAAGSADQLNEVRRWLNQTGLEDRRLAP